MTSLRPFIRYYGSKWRAVKLRTLLANLRDAAALCRSFALGAGVPLGPGERRVLKTGTAWIPAAYWHPGCQKEAP